MKAIKLIRVIRERAIIQRKMAQDIGISPQKLNDILMGRMDGWKYRRRISQYLGVDEDILFPGDHVQCQSSKQ